MLTSALSLIGSLLTNRIGQFALVAFAVWAWTSHNTASYWKGVIAQEKAAVEAAYKAEVARQAEAAKEIAAAATARAEDNAKAVSDMQKVISDYETKLKETHHVAAPTHCVVDDDFSRIVHELSPAGRRAPTPPATAGKVRKAR